MVPLMFSIEGALSILAPADSLMNYDGQAPKNVLYFF